MKQSKLMAGLCRASRATADGPLMYSRRERQTPLHTDPVNAVLASTSALDMGWLTIYSPPHAGRPLAAAPASSARVKDPTPAGDTLSAAWLSARKQLSAHLHLLATGWQTMQKCGWASGLVAAEIAIF